MPIMTVPDTTVDITPVDHLRALEAEASHPAGGGGRIRAPVMLYSIGKDSSVMLRLAHKAFYPGRSVSLLHATPLQVPEMIEFGITWRGLSVTASSCTATKKRLAKGPALRWNTALLRLLKPKGAPRRDAGGNFDAALGGARRDEERSRAKERIFSVRDPNGQWDPKRQRPELWNILNARIRPGESIRVFPLSNWTEIDVWQYIHVEKIPIVPLYYAKERQVIVRGQSLIVQEQPFVVTMPGEKPQTVKCRMRSLGCSPCTAPSVGCGHGAKIISELIVTGSPNASCGSSTTTRRLLELKKREVLDERPSPHLHGWQR